MVGGVSPGKGGMVHLGVPVFNSVLEVKPNKWQQSMILFVYLTKIPFIRPKKQCNQMLQSFMCHLQELQRPSWRLWMLKFPLLFASQRVSPSKTWSKWSTVWSGRTNPDWLVPTALESLLLERYSSTKILSYRLTDIITFHYIFGWLFAVQDWYYAWSHSSGRLHRHRFAFGHFDLRGCPPDYPGHCQDVVWCANEM